VVNLACEREMNMKSEHRFSLEERLIGRRSFLRMSGLIGLGAASGFMLPKAAEALKFDQKNYKVSETRLAMGTVVSMTLIHPSKDHAEEAMGLAFKEIDRLSAMMNRFAGSAAISTLNKDGRLRDLPTEMQHVLERSLFFYKITGGAFDITVKPVVDLFQEKYEKGRQIEPGESELKGLIELVNAGNVEISGRSVSFKRHGMGITLDGIAKGYIVDKASELLSARKISNHLINAGGDIRTAGSGEGGKPWTVAVEDPRKKNQYPDIIHMRDGAIATSGNYEVYYDREKMFHHIVNPRTGLSPALSTSVSVMAKTTMDADALSTSVFVMDPEPGIQFINSLPDCHSLVIDRSGKILRSSNWKSAAA
jgi:thiamine biosynthesis lipoprotein